MAEPKYHRILLKLSGEALTGTEGDSISPEVLEYYAQEIEKLLQHNVQVAVVLGGGNIWRGNRATSRGMDTAQSHYMGMLATIINALALQDALEGRGVFTRAMTAINGVDGIYSADPKHDPSATRFDQISYMDALQRGLTVMDSTALTFCMDNHIPIIVFDPMKPGNIERIVLGEHVGTLVTDATHA